MAPVLDLPATSMKWKTKYCRFPGYHVFNRALDHWITDYQTNIEHLKDEGSADDLGGLSSD